MAHVAPSMSAAKRVVETAEEGLARGLGRWQALAIVVGAVVGTGIYIRPADIAQLVKTPTVMMLVWFGAGLLSLLGALTYAELATRIPRSGGEYAFLRVTLGALPAFLFGWMRLTVGVGSIAALSVAFTVFLADVFPLRGAWYYLALPWFGFPMTIELGPRQLIAVLVIAGLAFLNIRGVAKAGLFQTGVTAIKVTGLLALVVLVALLGHAAPPPANDPITSDAVGSRTFAYSSALLAAMAAYNGWAFVAMLGGEVRDAQRNVPWALVVGIGVVILLYLAANVAYLYILPISDLLSANSTAHVNASSVASRAASAALGPRVGVVLPLLFMVSALGSLHCNLLAVPRVFFAMARDGLLPASLGRISKTARTPVVAIGALALMGALLAVLGSYNRLANMSTFGCLIFYVLNALGLLRLRGSGAAARHPRWGLVATWIPVVFSAGTLWLLVTLVMRGAVEIMAALILIGVGVPVYALTRASRTAAPGASS